MKLSFSTHTQDIKSNNGYGYAGRNIIKSLRELGHDICKHTQAPVHLIFAQPENFEFYPNQYKIGYTPWESSGLPRGWLETFNLCDEVWTTSPLCARWYREAGVTRPIYVYEHGLEDVWIPRKRKVHQKLRFLHIGEPAPRKAGQLALDAFRAAFGNRDDVELTIKSQGQSTLRVYNGGSIIGLPHEVYANVRVIEEDLTTEELYSLYRTHHAMVYPSWGEGFGFIPLQALVTGMPAICTSEWAPYSGFLRELALSSTESPSPWPTIHPGNMLEPDFDDLVDLYRYVADKFDKLSDIFYEQAPLVKARYDWNTLTANIMKHLEN